MLTFRDAPIGVFDSGVGGLTVVKSLRARLPHEHFVYLGDTARIPYGTKSPATIERYAEQNVTFLDRMGIKMLVVACNTASALALAHLKELSPIPVVGVIQPGAKQAVRATKSGRVGVIATEATVASGAYARAINGFNPTAKVFTHACPLFVGLAEEGWTDHQDATELIARAYLAPLVEARVDTLVLGCTHYPILKTVIGNVMGEGVRLIDSGDAVAEEVASLLAERGALRLAEKASELKFFVTDGAERFARVAQRFLGAPVTQVQTVEVVK